MNSEPAAAAEFPFVRLPGSALKRPIVWLLIENPHDEEKPAFRFPALIDTGADKSVVPHKLCKILGHAFDVGRSSGEVSEIWNERILVHGKGVRMKVALNTLSKRQDAVLEALKRNEKISVSHAGKVVATLQPQGIPMEKKKHADNPFFGIWADRKDMDDPATWRQSEWRKQRESREAGLYKTKG